MNQDNNGIISNKYNAMMGMFIKAVLNVYFIRQQIIKWKQL